MNKEQKLSLLNQFSDTNDYREWMQKPFRYKEWLCATDGYRILFIQAKRYKWEEAIPEVSPKFANNIDQLLSVAFKQRNGGIEREDITTMIDSLPKIKQVVGHMTALCPECEGRGEVEGVYDSKYYHDCERDFIGECPVCNGDGEIEVKIVERRPSRKYITVKGITIKSSGLWDILNVMDASKSDYMAAFPNNDHPFLMLSDGGGTTLLIMGCLNK